MKIKKGVANAVPYRNNLKIWKREKKVKN